MIMPERWSSLIAPPASSSTLAPLLTAFVRRQIACRVEDNVAGAGGREVGPDCEQSAGGGQADAAARLDRQRAVDGDARPSLRLKSPLPVLLKLPSAATWFKPSSAVPVTELPVRCGGGNRAGAARRDRSAGVQFDPGVAADRIRQRQIACGAEHNARRCRWSSGRWRPRACWWSHRSWSG